MIRTRAIVVGLGAMGSAVCRQLAARGIPVVGIDRHRPPHVHGSTHGDTRITRLITVEGSQYVPLAVRSHDLWRELEAETGERLLHEVGTLMISRAGSPFLRLVGELAERFSLPHESLDAGALRTGFPMFAVADDAAAMLDPGGGYVRPEVALAAQLRLAERDGAQLRLDETVHAWTATAEGVSVDTGTETITASSSCCARVRGCRSCSAPAAGAASASPSVSRCAANCSTGSGSRPAMRR